jgi:hypothetical protein
MRRPKAIDTAGTMMIHSSVLSSVWWKSDELSSLVKFCRPTKTELSSLLKALMVVTIAG